MSDCLFTIPVKITGPQGLAFCSKHFNRFFFTHIIPLPSISSRPSRPKQLVHAGARQLAHFQLPRRHGRQLREDASRTNPGGLGEVINPKKKQQEEPLLLGDDFRAAPWNFSDFFGVHLTCFDGEKRGNHGFYSQKPCFKAMTIGSVTNINPGPWQPPP